MAMDRFTNLNPEQEKRVAALAREIQEVSKKIIKLMEARSTLIKKIQEVEDELNRD